MEYITNGKTIKKNIHKKDKAISYVKLAEDEYLIIAVNYSEPLLDKAINLLKNKGISIKQSTGNIISYRYICKIYIATKNGIINEKDLQYIEKIIKKNDYISKVE